MPPKKADSSSSALLYKEGEKLPPIEDLEFLRRLLLIAGGEADTIGGKPTVPPPPSVQEAGSSSFQPDGSSIHSNNNNNNAAEPNNNNNNSNNSNNNVGQDTAADDKASHNSSFRSNKSTTSGKAAGGGGGGKEGASSPSPLSSNAPSFLALTPAGKEVILQLLTSYIALSREHHHRPSSSASGSSSSPPPSYWSSLQEQIEVDHCVEFILYAAERQYTPRKTQHVLQFLQRFKGLVESGTPGKSITPLPLDIYNVEKQWTSPTPTTTAVGAAGEPVSEKAKARRASGSKNSRSASNVETVVPPTPVEQREYQAVLADEVAHFLAFETEMVWWWENTPREAPSADSAAEKNASPAAAGSGKGKKEKKGEKGKPVPLSGEEARYAAIRAALPPENIYLREKEGRHFVEYFIEKGMLQHHALYRAVATEPQQEPERRTKHLLREVPLIIPSLDKATLLSPLPAFIQAEITAAVAAHAPTNSKGVPSPPPEEEEQAAEVKPPLTPRSQLQHEIDTELAIYERRYAEECTGKDNREKAAQLEKDMTFVVAKEGAAKVVEDVYEEMEEEVNTRQTRILQRIAALEKALSVKKESESS